MAYLVEVTARASRNLDAIYDFIQAEVSQQAEAWFNGLADALHSLSKMPARSPATREQPSLRHLLYGRKPHVYRIVYHVDDAAMLVTIVTIRHGARDSATSAFNS